MQGLQMISNCMQNKNGMRKKEKKKKKNCTNAMQKRPFILLQHIYMSFKSKNCFMQSLNRICKNLKQDNISIFLVGEKDKKQN